MAARLAEPGEAGQITIVAGTLPDASRRVIPQSMVPLRPWTSVPPLFVMAAKRRSVPTAVVGTIPKTSTSRGVISEPPPTPVKPTRPPTMKPETE